MKKKTVKKKKVGAPLKKEADKKKVVSISLTKKQSAGLKKLAKKQKLSVSAVLRNEIDCLIA